MISEHDIEEWREVPNFEDYDVSSFGRVRLTRVSPLRPRMQAAGYILKQKIDRDGYASVSLIWNRKINFFRVHCLMLSVFVGPRPDGMLGCHNDGNPSHNYLNNLRWDTSRNNKLDSIDQGTYTHGAKHYLAKISDENVIEICRLRNSGMTQQAIANIFGLSQPNVSWILRGKGWPHVPRPTDISC